MNPDTPMQNFPLPEVRAQYEDYPYPPRAPAEERTRLIGTQGDLLDLANYYCFGGRQGFADGFRALVAGCGTGDSVVFLAEQLRDANGEVVALDFSAASLDVARKRCEARSLPNVRFVRAAIQDIPGLALGEFDFINCTGVLHHMADPDEGLRVLARGLKDSGGMYLMVYASYGRAAIYPMQELLRHIAGPEIDVHDRMRRTRMLIGQLPQSNAFKREFDRVGADIVQSGDAGLYDLLLHARDRSYTVPELYRLLEQAGLRLAAFDNPGMSGMTAYDPAFYLRDPELLEIIARKPLAQQHAIAELVAGNLSKHSCFTTKREVRPPSPADPTAIPFIPAVRGEREIYRALFEQMEAARKRGQVMTVTLDDSPTIISVKATRTSVLFMKHMDGERSVGELCACVKRDLAPGPDSTTPPDEELLKEFCAVFDGFFRTNCMLLRYPGSRQMPSVDYLQQRMLKQSARHNGQSR